MADHRGYWSQVGREAESFGRRGVERVKSFVRESSETKKVFLCLGAILCVALLYSVWPSGSLATAPEGEVPDYKVTLYDDLSGETGPSAGLHLSVESTLFGRELFRTIAQDLRFKHPEHELILIVFERPDPVSGIARGEAHAMVAASEEKARQALVGYSDEAITRVMDDEDGIEVEMW